MIIVAVCGELIISDGFQVGTGNFVVARDPFFRYFLLTQQQLSILKSRGQILQLYDGAQINLAGDAIYVCRDPFCSGVVAQPITCIPNTVSITSPANGSNYFWTMPSVSVDVNFTVFGTHTPISCAYKINSGDWNIVAPCDLGNNSVAGVTMPEGYPVTLLVNQVDICTNLTKQTQFSVYYRNGYYTDVGGASVFWMAGLLLLYTMILGSRKYYNRAIQRL